MYYKYYENPLFNKTVYRFAIKPFIGYRVLIVTNQPIDHESRRPIYNSPASLRKRTRGTGATGYVDK